MNLVVKLFQHIMQGEIPQIQIMYVCVFPIEHAFAGHHVGGQGKWGNCGPGCPIPPDDRLGPTTPFPKGKGRSPKMPISDLVKYSTASCFDHRQKTM